MKTYTKNELAKIRRLHSCWLADSKIGSRADLSGADLNDANLNHTDLRRADLSGAYLRGADLSRADLRGADLSGADLSGAYLSRADLRGAYLSDADLSGAYLRGADLSGADLSGADLSGAYLSGAYLSRAVAERTIVPEVGAFTAFKKVKNADKHYVIRLEIPADAKRLGGLVGRKCRVEKAIFVAVETQTELTEFFSGHDPEFVYKLGGMIVPKTFNDDPREECAAGIHCFITKKEAEDYDL